MPRQLSELKPDVMVGCPKVSDVVAEGAIQDAAIQFYRDSRLKRLTLTAIDIVADQAEYALANPTGYQIVDPCWATYNGAPIYPISEEQMDLRHSEERAARTSFASTSHHYEGLTDTDWRASTSGRPSLYYCSEPNLIRLIGIPTTAAAGALVVNVAVQPLDSVEEIDDWIYQAYKPGIIAKAISGLFLMPQKPWTNPNAAAVWDGEYERIKNEAASRASRGNARTDRPLRTTAYSR